jgi:hypothetical protein
MSEAIETNAELEASLRALAEVERETEPEQDRIVAEKASGMFFTFCGETVRVEAVNPFLLEQPENDPASDPATFRIGQRNQRTGYREAIPRWRWPNPGQPGSRDLIAEYEEGLSLWMEAAQNLTNFIWYRHRKNLGEDLYAFENGGTGPRMDRIWSWLCGLWQARGMNIPSEEEISRLVDEIHGKSAKR